MRPASCVHEEPWQGVCPWSSHHWPGLLAGGPSVPMCVVIYLTLLLVWHGRVRERCARGGGNLLGQPAFLFSCSLPSACEDLLVSRTCSSSHSLSILGVTAGEAPGKSWNAILQLGAPQHCLLHVQRPAFLCQPGHLCIPSVLSPLSSHTTLGGAGGWWHSRHSEGQINTNLSLAPSAASWQGEGCVYLLPL